MRYLFLLLALALLGSCSIEKRLYRSGFYVDHVSAPTSKQNEDNSTQQTVKQTHIAERSNETSPASVDNDAILPVITEPTTALPPDTIYYQEKKTTVKNRKTLMLQTSDERGLLMLDDAKSASTLILLTVPFLFFFTPVGLILIVAALILIGNVRKKMAANPGVYSPDNLFLIQKSWVDGLLISLVVLVVLGLLILGFIALITGL